MRMPMRHTVASMLSSLMRVRGETMTVSATALQKSNTAQTAMARTMALPPMARAVSRPPVMLT